MARKLSTAAANFLATLGSITELHEGGVLMYYSGSQPANADAAATGTALVRFTTASGAWTKEVRATAVIDFASATGNCTALTVAGISLISGAVTYTTAAELATAVAANINAYRHTPRFTATVSASTKVTITAPKNSGATLNGLAVAVTVAAGSVTINGSDADTLGASGTNGGQVTGITQVNGLAHIMAATGGVAVKSGVWSGVAGSGTGTGKIGFVNAFTSGTQTVGWFRYYASPTDPELSGTPTADTGAAYLRIDGTVATSGGDITATGGTTITYDATHTENTYTLSVPLAQ